ncbi:hypothetical protein ECZU11_11820 [Escherichia coli]|nr:hypothetical protein ECZU11_11820 [Escherichia coli]
MPRVCAGTLRAGAAAGIAGREDCHVAVLQPVPWRRRAAALVVMVATFISLVAAGWIFTALIYLVASLFFRLIRKACRQRLEGRELCQS